MYKHIAPSYNALHGEEQERKLKKLLAYIALEDGAKVADIGCGTAHLAKYFTRQTYIGIDPCQELIDQAPEGVRVLCAPGEAIPLPEGSQDIVLSLTALHNYKNPKQGVKELNRIAKNIILVGVLKKSPRCSRIVSELKKTFFLITEMDDPHDKLFVLRKKP